MLQFVQQAMDIGLGIMTLAVAVHLPEACREDTRSTVEGLDLESGIIGKAIETIVVMHVACLLQCVALQCGSRLGDVLMAAYFGKPLYQESLAQYLPHFLQLVGIVRGHDEFFHCR